MLDTRIAAGLPGALASAQPQTLDVTGTIPVVLPGDITSTGTPVPDGATAIVANVTIVGPHHARVRLGAARYRHR